MSKYQDIKTFLIKAQNSKPLEINITTKHYLR